jgi:hypothetical protein
MAPAIGMTARMTPASLPLGCYSRYTTTQWGTEHPDHEPHGNVQRAQWTDEVLDFIDVWFKKVNVTGNENYSLLAV